MLDLPLGDFSMLPFSSLSKHLPLEFMKLSKSTLDVPFLLVSPRRPYLGHLFLQDTLVTRGLKIIPSLHILQYVGPIKSPLNLAFRLNIKDSHMTSIKRREVQTRENQIKCTLYCQPNQIFPNFVTSCVFQESALIPVVYHGFRGWGGVTGRNGRGVLFYIGEIMVSNIF